MIEVKNLTKKYGDKLAVNNISFKVEKGEILGSRAIFRPLRDRSLSTA